MNRMETKIVIMVTNRLAEAKDSDAKTEMIEELSENLYQRYLELAESGMPEKEALQKAEESLGDVEELLVYLREAEQEEDASGGDSTLEFQEKDDSRTKENSSFSKSDLESGIEEIVNAALSTAKVAVDCAKDVAKDVSGQIKEKYPDGVFRQFTIQKGRKRNCMFIPQEDVHSLEIYMSNGDVTLECTGEKDGFIEIEGEEIETMLKDDGVLSVSQKNTASASYFFMRGIRRYDLEVRLPERMWNRVILSTRAGDVGMNGGLVCEELKITTTSGDVELEDVSCSSMELRSASGDMEGYRLTGALRAETKSGDIELEESCCERCELFSASGDVSFSGESKEMTCTSTSGDVELEMKNIPEKLTGSSISGDCEIRVPEEQGFRISYKTVSGDFETDLPLSGKVGERSGEAVFGDGCGGELRFSSVSGDVCIWAAK